MIITRLIEMEVGVAKGALVHRVGANERMVAPMTRIGAAGIPQEPSQINTIGVAGKDAVPTLSGRINSEMRIATKGHLASPGCHGVRQGRSSESVAAPEQGRQ